MRTYRSFLLATVRAATIIICRLRRQPREARDREKEELRATTAELRRRNEQLTALANVFADITQTLSLPYVANATLRETLAVMSCDMTVLRVLRGDKLVVLGALAKDGRALEFPDIPVGQGPMGKVAETGQAIRFDHDGEQMMRPPGIDGYSGAAQQLGEAPNESGIIVPLVVGSRRIGALACWSRQKGAFGLEDERIMAMMASQVATAMVAADTMEASEYRARHDPLTGLPNRLQLENDLRGGLAGYGAGPGATAVVAMADIDHFKRFNDEFGHGVGDMMLQMVASVLRRSVRDCDRVYRYGGEEFLLIFVNAEAAEAQILAERVRVAMETTPLRGGDLEAAGPLTISIGLALVADRDADIRQAIDLADAAMYRAKGKGGNSAALWTAAMAEDTVAA